MSTPVQFDSESQTRSQESSVFAGGVFSGNTAASSRAVNRTHRVVRHKATVLKARRSYIRSLMLPLIICSVLLILTGFAVWSGLYQYQGSGAAEAVQDVSSSLPGSDDGLMLVLFWFVPVTLALLGTVWFTRFRQGVSSGMGR